MEKENQTKKIEFPEILKSERKRLGWTRKKMYEKTGIPAATIDGWERGMTTPPDYIKRYVLKDLAEEIRSAKSERLGYYGNTALDKLLENFDEEPEEKMISHDVLLEILTRSEISSSDGIKFLGEIYKRMGW